MVGKMLGQYRIEAKLGAGGMGEVWQALDTQLDRQVAIKILPARLAEDPERLARFEREARVLASLNHRNIAAIYGLGEEGTVRFLVMELVEGEDLAARISRGPLPVDEAIDLCRQLARALEAAHEKGVLHRDLKPANVRITPDDRVKVLDFGLAKSLDPAPEVADSSPTMTSLGATRAGVILGTAAYMSPEQARGKTLDKRADIWSFGCILFECLTGKPAFEGETVSDTLASVLRSDPDWAALSQDVPLRVRDLLERCLEKDVRNRLRDIGDAWVDLSRSESGSLSSMSAREDAVPLRHRLRRRVGWGWTLVAAGVAFVMGLMIAGGDGRAPRGDVVRLSLHLPEHLFTANCLLVPDGSGTVCVGAHTEEDAKKVVVRLYSRSFDSYRFRALEGTDDVENFAVSPDGRWVAVRGAVAHKAAKARLSKVPLDGSGPPLPMMDWREEWLGPLLWHPDGDLLVRADGGKAIVRIPTGGGRPSDPLPITPVGFEGNFQIEPTPATVLPGGRHVLGMVSTFRQRGFDRNVAVLDLDSGQARIVVENGGSPRWSPTGHLLFTRGATLLAMPFDPQTQQPAGDQVAITDGLRAESLYLDAFFDLARNGTLLHRPGGLVGGKRELVLLDDLMRETGLWSPERRSYEGGLAVAPDLSRTAVSIVNGEGFYEIWESDFDRPALVRSISEPGLDCSPDFYDERGTFVYTCGSTTRRLVYAREAATGEVRLLRESDPQEVVLAVAEAIPGDSRLIAARRIDERWSVVTLDRSAARPEPELLVEDARSPTLSPDGKWLAYLSDDSGRTEVYVRRVRPGLRLGPELPVTRLGTDSVLWRRGEDAELAYLRGLSVYAVRLEEREGSPTTTSPREISRLTDLATRIQNLTPLSDGRFLIVRRGEDEGRKTDPSIVVNWFEELEDLVGARRR